jgi:hypothetical protein
MIKIFKSKLNDSSKKIKKSKNGGILSFYIVERKKTGHATNKTNDKHS